MSTTNTVEQSDREQVIIFDTTLRDGEQSPGCSMNLAEKLRVAAQLEAMGVDVIEAGFPAASNGDFEAVQRIAAQAKKARITGLSRASEKDIARAAEAVKPAPLNRIHTFISTSPLHMEHKLRMTPEQVLERVENSVTLARNLVEDVEWSAEDGTRTEHDFLCRCVETAIRCGARTINIPDTVGYTVPEEYYALIKMLFDRVPNIDKAVLSVHCHNDLGLAVANTLSGLQAGARQVECTINGIGERAGNAALEEVVMALRTRAELFNLDTNIDSTLITKASGLISTITGFSVQPNKAIVGANAFAHESGIHQDGMLKHAGTYEIMTPASVGLTESNLVLGKHSGRHAFREKLAELGYELGDNALNDAFQRFKDLADRKKEVYDEDLIALVDDETGHDNDYLRFKSVRIQAGSEGPQVAKLELFIDGEVKAVETEGQGPVDACFRAMRALFPHDAVLERYEVKAVTGGTDAQAEVVVKLTENGKSVLGSGADIDTLVASCRAYVHALNKLIVKRQRKAPDALTA